jgi:uncharacterized protein YcbX
VPAAWTIAALSVTPVKGLRVSPRQTLWLGPDGARENRRFYLVDESGRMVNAKRIGALQTVVADYDDAARTLALTFADGTSVSGEIELGEEIDTTFFSLSLRSPTVLGPFSAALSEHLEAPVRLVEADPRRPAVDRGKLGAVSLVSTASVERLAAVAARDTVDPRRFRMLVEVAGPDAHQEDGWVGRSLRVGDARVLVHGHVGRCLVTGLDPDSGKADLPTLDLLRGYRGELDATEPLPFGVYGQVVEPGRISVGDPVEAA